MSGGAILIVWTDIEPALEADFNDWYNQEHLPDRVGRMPGFLRGRRYEACDAAGTVANGAPRFLTYYDLESASAMQSDAHVALRRDRSERDRFFVPRFRNTIKGICDVVCRVGPGGGEYLALLPVAPLAPVPQGDFAAWLSRLSSQTGVTGTLYAARNHAVTSASSAKDDRAGDRYVDGLLVVHAQTLAAAQAAAAMLTHAALASFGLTAQWMAAPSVLRLIHSLEAQTGPAT